MYIRHGWPTIKKRIPVPYRLPGDNRDHIQ
jgi:hypothetical protein